MKKVFETFKESFINENLKQTDINNVKPNVKLKKGTGYPYAMFYISTQAANIMIDFENEDHISLIELLEDQKNEIEENNELSSSSINKGKRMFLKILGEKVVYSKYHGADCTFRLSTLPDTTLKTGQYEWYNDSLLKYA